MWFLGEPEIRSWCQPHKMLGADLKPTPPLEAFDRGRFSVGEVPVSLIRLVTDQVVRAIGPWEESLLIVRPSNSWNRENFHLYYRLRQSYGDFQRLNRTMGHCFLAYEEQDLISFLQVVILNQWNGFVFSAQDYGRALVFDNGIVELLSRDGSDLSKALETLRGNGISTDVE